jgi:hypothetical protein
MELKRQLKENQNEKYYSGFNQSVRQQKSKIGVRRGGGFRRSRLIHFGFSGPGIEPRTETFLELTT